MYGDGMLMYTLPDRYEARGLFHLFNALRGEGRRVLLLGSGPGALLHNLLAASGVERISYFEPILRYGTRSHRTGISSTRARIMRGAP